MASVDIASLIYTLTTFAVPLISYWANRKRTKKSVKGVESNVTHLLKKIETLEGMDELQQREINRLKRLKKMDSDRMVELHKAMRKKGGESS